MNPWNERFDQNHSADPLAAIVTPNQTNVEARRVTINRSAPRIYVDFLKTDGKGRLQLTTLGTREDLQRHAVTLHDGLKLTLISDDANERGERDDLLVEGTIRFDAENKSWVAEIDWDAIRHESELDPHT